MRFKPSEALRFLGGIVLAVVLLGLLMFRVTSCSPVSPPVPALAPSSQTPRAPPPAVVRTDCAAPGFEAAAAVNGQTLTGLAWAPFKRPETGWRTYAPLVGREIGSACDPASAGFARDLAAWQRARKLPATGQFAEADFKAMTNLIYGRRTFRVMDAEGVCLPAPAEASLDTLRPEEAYGNKVIRLNPEALAAYREMAAAARAEAPEIAADPRNLQVFSGYRSPDEAAARCAQGGCDGVSRGRCSPHQTGLALDLYVGASPGGRPDSTEDANRLWMSQAPAYRWLVRNADRFGFSPYPFEPWHWEYIGRRP